MPLASFRWCSSPKREMPETEMTFLTVCKSYREKDLSNDSLEMHFRFSVSTVGGVPFDSRGKEPLARLNNALESARGNKRITYDKA